MSRERVVTVFKLDGNPINVRRSFTYRQLAIFKRLKVKITRLTYLIIYAADALK